MNAKHLKTPASVDQLKSAPPVPGGCRHIAWLHALRFQLRVPAAGSYVIEV
ncbi:MAG: hypothetical protein IPI07_04120 [Flavobacteriales bacterium]|nr:hypothetical protein [Flavobacteriales bacterium]